MQMRAGDSNASLSFDRRVPLWGIIVTLGGMFITCAGFCISFYISNIKMADSIDRLTTSVDKQVQNDIARNITQVRQESAIAENTKAISKLERDVELLKSNQRWAPK
jgi:hypothetical protein